MATISKHRSRGVSLFRSRPLGVLGVLLLAIGVALVTLLVSVSVGPKTEAFAATNESLLAPQQLSIRDLGTLGGAYSYANAINDLGQIVGSSTTTANGFGGVHAFLWQAGKMRDLGNLGGTFTIAFGINDREQVVGYSYTASDREHAFLWQNGKMRGLGTLDGRDSEAYGINNLGQVVGTSQTASGAYHAVLWTKSLWTQ